MSWKDIESGEIAAYAPMTAELMAKLTNRDLAAGGHCCGGRWAAVSTNYVTSRNFLKVWVPRWASGLYIECESGISVVTSMTITPQVYLNIDNGMDTGTSDVIALVNAAATATLVYPQLVAFPMIPVPTGMRASLADVSFQPVDSNASRLYWMRNDPGQPNHGYGIRWV